MEKFERPMKKEYSKGKFKQYIITLGKNTEISENRFHDVGGRMVCDVVICYPDELEELIQENENLKTEIKSIENNADELSDIKGKHKKEIKNIEDEYNKQIAELNQQLNDKDIEIEKVRTEYEKEIGDLKESNQKKINSLNLFDEYKHITIKEHDTEIDKLKKEIGTLKETQFNDESDMKIKDHNDAVSKLDLFDDEKHMKIKDHNNEINNIKDDIFRTVIPHNDKLNELDSMGFFGFARHKHKNLIKELKEDITHFKQLGTYSESYMVDVNKENGENE